MSGCLLLSWKHHDGRDHVSFVYLLSTQVLGTVLSMRQVFTSTFWVMNSSVKQPVLRINSSLLSFNYNYYYQLSNYGICPKKVLFNLSQPPFALGIIELKELWFYVVQSPHCHPQLLVKRPSPPVLLSFRQVFPCFWSQTCKIKIPR